MITIDEVIKKIKEEIGWAEEPPTYGDTEADIAKQEGKAWALRDMLSFIEQANKKPEPPKDLKEFLKRHKENKERFKE